MTCRYPVVQTAHFNEQNILEKIMVAITYAGYGVWERTRDATTAIKRAYAEGQRKFLANNDWVGDPAPGERKYLYIVWDGGGFPTSGVVGEDDGKGVNLP
jgi:hypothetical protein